jgi:hypothetical protein
MEHRITDVGDSGIYYRAEKHATIKWAISGGYQDPIEGPNWRVEAKKRPGAAEFDAAMERSSPGWTKTERFTGGNHGGKRQFMHCPASSPSLSMVKSAPQLEPLDNSTKIGEILGNGWVESHIIREGHVLIHVTNRSCNLVVIGRRRQESPHRGPTCIARPSPDPPMKVEFRKHPAEDDRAINKRRP